MENNSISKVLTIVLVFMILLLFILSIVYIVLKLKEKTTKKNDNKKNIDQIKSKNVSKSRKGEAKSKASNPLSSYSKMSIYDFMEFDDVQDNMIVQKNGKRYLVVVECQGVNYDLMSKLEKNGVEEGFQQFLNTLRHPIQIYIQTRTMNLEGSIQNYKDKVKEIENRYNKLQRDYRAMKESEAYSEEDLNKQFFELTRAKNLLEYGKDIIVNTERMSLNKNVLTKKYYIVISYFPEEDGNYSIEEIRNMAFAELYTKAQGVISTLSACSVTGHILDSHELIELLYMTYNREEADTYGLERALAAEYDNLYSTAPDVFEKKIKALDQEIEERAIELANKKIDEIKSRPQQKAETKEASLDDLVNKMAQIILGNNRSYVGNDVAEQAIQELKQEGGKKNGNVEAREQKTKTRRNN